MPGVDDNPTKFSEPKRRLLVKNLKLEGGVLEDVPLVIGTFTGRATIGREEEDHDSEMIVVLTLTRAIGTHQNLGKILDIMTESMVDDSMLRATDKLLEFLTTAGVKVKTEKDAPKADDK